MTTLSLSEVNQILDSIESPLDAMNDERVQNYITEVEDSGAEILKSRGEGFLKDADAFLSACALASLISDGNVYAASGLISDVKSMRNMIISVFTYAVGISASEELR